MSRYLIEQTGEREVVVGWDAPMGTFFAQEFKPEALVTDDDEDEGLVWQVGGSAMREIPTITELRRVLILRGVVIPKGVDARLRADEAEPWTPGPLQKALGFTGKEG